VGHQRRRWLLGLVAGALALALVASGCGGDRDLPEGSARITRIVDGDTVEVAMQGSRHRVRLLGIDTPETVHPTKPVECFGPEASAALADLIPEGSVVRLERDTELRDRFGRLLLYLWNEDDTFVNEAMVANGFAETLHIAPNGAYRADLDAAQAEARGQGRGLWSACATPGR
jgi:micrococcal nuclease